MLRRGRFGPFAPKLQGFTRRLRRQGQLYLGFLPLVVHEKLVLLALPFKPLRAPFRPSVRNVTARPICSLHLSAAECLNSFACLSPNLPSADFCTALSRPRDPLSPNFRTTMQTSRGKFDRLPHTPARSTVPPLDGYGLRGHRPARPGARPLIWFLFVRSWVCSALPSDPTSR